jgi:hypothetical protein
MIVLLETTGTKIYLKNWVNLQSAIYLFVHEDYDDDTERFDTVITNLTTPKYWVRICVGQQFVFPQFLKAIPTLRYVNIAFRFIAHNHPLR